MRVTWMGHGSFRIEIAGQVLLLDPWITGNPSFPEDSAAQALDGATAILLTHGHFDHTQDCTEIAKERGLKLYGMYELVNWFTAIPGVEGTGFNKGGTVRIGDVGVTLVAASHSSSVQSSSGPIYVGQECGMMIEGEGKTLYAMGDTDVMADFAWMAELHRPNLPSCRSADTSPWTASAPAGRAGSTSTSKGRSRGTIAPSRCSPSRPTISSRR